MQKTVTIFRITMFLAILVALCGLIGWYLYLRSHSTDTEITDAATGLGTEAPSFSGNISSTFANVTTELAGQNNAAAPSSPTAQGVPDLWKVSLTPSAGAGFVQKGGQVRLYFVERASGNVLAADLQSGTIERLTNTLLPKIYRALVAGDGSVIEQSLDESGAITTFAGVPVPPPPPKTATIATSTTGTLKGIYLDKGIVVAAADPAGSELFYIVNDPKAGPVGIRSLWNGTKARRVFESALSQWQSMWLSDGRIILVQNSAYNIPGSAYELGANGALSPLISNILGLTVLPRSGSKTFLYSTSAQGSTSLYSYTPGGEFIPIPLKTITDKCVWAPGKDLIAYCAVPTDEWSGNFLDNWYEGYYHSSDSWWKVDAKNGEVRQMFAEVANGPKIDVDHPTIDQSGTHIAFMNAVDSSLWVLKLPAATSTKK